MGLEHQRNCEILTTGGELSLMLSLCKSKSLFVFLNLAWAESMIFLLCRTQLDKSQQTLALLFYKTVIFVAPCYGILIILKLCRVLVCLLAELILLFFQSFHIKRGRCGHLWHQIGIPYEQLHTLTSLVRSEIGDLAQSVMVWCLCLNNVSEYV